MGEEQLAAKDAVRSAPPPRFNWLGKESETGLWVKATDHDAYVADLRRQIEQLSARLADEKVRAAQAEERCEHLIAVMAAHGSANEEASTAQAKEDGPLKP